MKTSKRRFAVNWDYRCPFARNAHEHVIAGLRAGAQWEVDFVPFSLSRVHQEEGDLPVWEDPDQRPDLLAPLVGIVVRDRFPDQFLSVHEALFRARHEESRDIRHEPELRQLLAAQGIDEHRVFTEIADGWPLESLRQAHEASVKEFNAFGVPTFISDGKAAFVRIMSRPGGDAAQAQSTIERVLEIVEDHPELNEIKHTSISR